MATSNPNFNLSVMKKTAVQFFEDNPILANKQIGQEEDSWRFKIGDGTTAWNELPYAVLGNEQSVWVGLSPDAGNLLELTMARAGFFLSPTTFDGRTLTNQASDGAVTDITPYLSSNQQLAGFVAAGLMIRKIIQALGTSWDLKSGNPIPATTVTQAIATVTGSVTTLSNTVDALINDSSASTSKTYSSTKINQLVTQAISNIVGAAPAALDTVYELAAALGNNPNLVTNIVTELGNTVKFTSQSLTEPQQVIARTNIGAAAHETVGLAVDNASTFQAKYEAEKQAAAASATVAYDPNPLHLVKYATFVAKPIGGIDNEGVYILDTFGFTDPNIASNPITGDPIPNPTWVVYLPASPQPGDKVRFVDYFGSFKLQPAYINGNGCNILRKPEEYIIDRSYASRTFIFVDVLNGWLVY